MEPTIFVNVDINKEGNNHVAIMKTRLWPELIKFTKWILHQPLPGHVAHGAGINILNNAAIIVEGFITDLLVDEHKNRHPNQPRTKMKAEDGKWESKKNAYKKFFPKKLEDYKDYDTIDMLFAFRNNGAHGRSHGEVSKIEVGSGNKSKLESSDKNYQKVRTYLVTKRYLLEKDTSSNVDVLWKFQTAVSIFYAVMQFLSEVAKNHSQKQFEGLISELEYAWKV